MEALTTDRLRAWHLDLANRPARVRTKTGNPQKYKLGELTEDIRRKRKSSANRVLTILKAALNRAWRDGKISSDASWRRVEPFSNVEVARVRYLSIDEATRLIYSSDIDFRSLVEGALQTGARYGELTRLRVSDFNSDVGTLTIQQSKSGKARHIVLTDEGEQIFTRLCAGHQGNDLVFRKTNGESWKDSHQGRPMAEACRRADITPAVGIHALRHTWASHAVMNGVPLLVVAKNLGHADTRMVEKHYGHLAPSYVADAIRSGAPRFGAQQENIVPLRRRKR